jgi:acyl carrier protein
MKYIKGETMEVRQRLYKEIEKFLCEYGAIRVGKNDPLFGIDGALDSLGLVRLIVNIEDFLSSSYNLNVSLADEKAFSYKTSPFRTIESIVDYTCDLIKVN